MTQPLDLVLARLHEHGCKPSGSGGKYKAICPAHADTDPSLSIGVGSDGQVLLYCFGGCEIHAVLAAINLTAEQLSPPKAGRNGTTKSGDIYYSIRDVDGIEVARHYRRNKPDGTKEMWWGGPGGEKGLAGRKVATLPLFGSELLREFPDVTVVVTEGEKDALALRERKIIALGTVTGAGGKTAKCPAPSTLAVLKDREVILWPDDDDVGRQHMALIARGLRGIAKSVHTIAWTGPKPKCGAADFTGTDDELLELLGMAKPEPPGRAAPGVTIDVTTDIAGVTDAAMAAVAAKHPHAIYQRSGRLVVVREPEPSASSPERSAPPAITRMQPPRLRELMASSADWVVLTEKGAKQVLPPAWVVDTAMARTAWPEIRQIAAVSEIPIMRPDGSIAQVAGYDDATQVLYHPSIEFPPVLDEPTVDDVRTAHATLCEPLCDFGFVDESAKTAALAAILSIVARHAILGSVPMFHFGAPVRGSGKTLLATACSIAATGRSPATFTSSRDENERAKEVVAIGLSGASVVLLDNLEGSFASSTMAAVLTSPHGFRGRLLGVSEIVNIPMRAVWLSSGNNVMWGGDLGRRVVPVIQDPKCESPEDRNGFRYPRLIEAVREMHPKLVSAALTILRAHTVAGRPAMMESRLGSFEAWDEVVRSALMWTTGMDPCSGRATLTESADSDVQDLHAVLEAWRSAWSLVGGTATAAQAVQRCVETMRRIKNGEHIHELDRGLVDAMRAICPTGELDSRRIGMWIQARAGRIVHGLRFDRTQVRNVAGWSVTEVDATS